MDSLPTAAGIGFIIGLLLGGVIGWRTGGERHMGCLASIGSITGIFVGMIVFAKGDLTEVPFMPAVGAILGFFLVIISSAVIIFGVVDSKSGPAWEKVNKILEAFGPWVTIILGFCGSYAGYQIGLKGWSLAVFSIGPGFGAFAGFLIGALIGFTALVVSSQRVEPTQWEQFFGRVAIWLVFFLTVDGALIGYQSVLKDWSQPVRPGFGILVGFLVGVLIGFIALVESSRRVESQRTEATLRRMGVWLIFFAGVGGACLGYGLFD